MDMKSKKSYIKTSLFLPIIIILVVVVTNKIGSNSEEGLLDGSSKQIKQENTLSMMIEQTAGAGDYKMEERTSWPADGYIFNETLSKCENGGILGWNSEKGVITMTGNMTDKCYIYFDKVPLTLARYIVSQYTGIQGENSIYYHDSSLTNGAGDSSYRYAGASSTVNNYVCFGSDAETCLADNLYRIIGVIDGKVKLIKSTSLGDMVWDDNASNTWSTSSLNTYLNGTYLTSLTNVWSDKIAITTWKVGGNTSENIESVVAKTAYTNEIISPTPTSTSTTGETEYSAKIGLMYVSDYGFAALPTAWGVNLNSYNGNDSAGTTITAINWLYLGSNEWTISRSTDFSNGVFFVNSSGEVYNNGILDKFFTNYGNEVRPVFYLISSAIYLNGDGTSENPYRLS